MNNADIKPAKRESFTVGDFVVTRWDGQRGEHMIFRVDTPMHQKDAGYRAMQIRGSRKCVEAPTPEALAGLPVFNAGVTSVERPPFLAAGRYVFEIIEPVLYICVFARRSWMGVEMEYLKGVSTSVELPQHGVLALGTGEGYASTRFFGSPAILYAESGALQVTPTKPLVGVKAWLKT